MKRMLFFLITLSTACPVVAEDEVPTVTDSPWQEAVVSVRDIDVTARFFREIGGYEDRNPASRFPQGGNKMRQTVFFPGDLKTTLL